MPEYKGSTFRGGFGNSFRKICCVQKQNTCKNCLLKEKCVYSVIFESSPSHHSEKLRNLEEIPRPFVIEPPMERKTEFAQGEEFYFGLTLFGKAVEYLPYMVYIFIELGKTGLGRGRGRFELKEVTDEKGDVIYDSSVGVFKNKDSTINFNSSPSKDTYNLQLTFLTPTRIKYNGRYISTPEFHIVIRALLRRISSLMYFYCEKNLDIDFKGLISRAEKVKMKQKDIRWIDWERYSSRQNTRMTLGGFVGEVAYEGNISEFMPFIELGVYTHIGKNCTFGLGKYEIVLLKQ